ncbi:AAA family ATPase [Actinomycetospora endophytica]|uniref:AAA family ATPase n=1 Tax=Actinomycetospora endophytica TaxID=2291215 RepID=A0ABS8PD61_9PSEU|nr:AAA family ATPase [Actinomycetospora endophytica]MCD2196215.1 AAA family ATPase [Actinomycetospora endophytica]
MDTDPWRRAEFDAIVDSWRSVRAGRPATVLLRAEAGAGKSRLVRRLVDHAEAEGAFVLTGASIDVGDQLPFWPLISALRGLLAPASAAAEDARAALAPIAAELPALLDPAPGQVVDPGAHGLELIRRVLTTLADAAPVLLAVEDLHWADPGTRDAVVTLAAHLHHEPVFVVVTLRPEAFTNRHPLQTMVAELRRHPRAVVRDLEPLDRGTVGRLVSAAVGDAPELVDRVWERSGGNAFIVAETLRAIAAGEHGTLPGPLRDLVLGRVAPMGPIATAVVQALALGEEPVPHRLLSDVVQLSEPALVSALRDAVSAALVVVDPATDGYALRHGLIREVISEELMPGERRELHRRYALALDRLLDELPADGTATGGVGVVDVRTDLVLRRAHHWYAAGDVASAVHAVAAAARVTERLRDYGGAHRQWTRVLELTDRRALRAGPIRRALTVGDVVGGTSGEAGDDSRDRAVLISRAAEVAHLAGEHERAVELLENLEPRTDITLATRLGRYLLDAGRPADAVKALDDAPVREVEATVADRVAAGPGAAIAPSRQLAALHAVRADALLADGDVREAQEQAQRALTLSRAGGDDVEQVSMLVTLGFALAYRENAEAGLAAVAEGLAVAERVVDAVGVGRAYQHWSELLVGPLGEIAEGVELARQGVARMRELGLARTFGVGLLALVANGLFRLGRWAEAQEAIDEAWALRPMGAEALEIRLARVRLLVGRGEFGAADQDLGAVELLSSTAGERRQVPLLTLRSGMKMWEGRPGEAREFVTAGLDVVDRHPDDVFIVAPLLWHGLRAEAEAAAHGDRDAEAVRRLVDRLHDLEGRIPSIVPALRRTMIAYSRMCRAELKRAQGAADPEAWRDVAERWSALLNPYPAAYAQLRRADALLGAGRKPSSEVRACLRAAADTAREMGAAPFLREIEAIAARAGLSSGALADEAADGSAAPSSPSRAPELSALTPREHEVLAAVAEGLTNRQVGRRLGLQERTVAVHVSNVLRKTNTRSRTQAAALLQRVRAR